MNHIDVFHQGEGFDDVGHVEVDLDTTFGTLKVLLAQKHGLPAKTVLLFIEDKDEPLGDDVVVKEHSTVKALKVHLHRLREVKVHVVYNGKTAEMLFSPSATVARVKRWAAEHEFGMSTEEAGEHVLQIAGTDVRPSPGTHIGALKHEKTRVLVFDLVPHERVQGALAVSW